MSLYPITIVDVATAILGPVSILSGSLIVIPIDMTTIQMTEINLNQMSNTQDFSLRAWVSVYKNGFPLGMGNYPILKFGGYPIVINIPTQNPPENTFSVAVLPGSYYLNILNLTNEGNVFGFQKTDLA